MMRTRLGVTSMVNLIRMLRTNRWVPLAMLFGWGLVVVEGRCRSFAALCRIGKPAPQGSFTGVFLPGDGTRNSPFTLPSPEKERGKREVGRHRIVR